MPEKTDALHAALRVNKVEWVIYRHGDSLRAFANLPGRGGSDVCDPGTFVGALPGAFIRSSIFLFYEDDGQIVYREMKTGTGADAPELGTAFIATPSLGKLPPHTGSFSNLLTFFASSGNDGHTYAYKAYGSAGQLIGSTKFDGVPVLSPVHTIPSGGSIAALQTRRQTIERVYQKNAGASASILQYLTEAFRLVPLQLALNMQSSGEFVAALDRYATVYDYRAAQGERNIDYGLEIDAGHPATEIYRHPEDWLLDPLNPHALALTRRYAHTRFTIGSIIGCFNAFGDAEFTYDTAESLVRARLMYTAAIELSNAPEVRQHLGACEALVGALVIEPGALVPPDVAAAIGAIVEELTQGRVASGPMGIVTLEKMQALIAREKTWTTLLPMLDQIKKEALQSTPLPATMQALVTDRSEKLATEFSDLLTDPAIERTARRVADIAIGEAFARVGV